MERERIKVREDRMKVDSWERHESIPDNGASFPYMVHQVHLS